MAYIWTATQPTQPGWYVFKFRNKVRAPDATLSICLQLVEQEESLWVQPEDGGTSGYALDELADGLWKGPIDLETL